MSYSNSVFQQLISSYPTWESLQTFLTSPEGGNFRIVGTGKYVIIRYVKGISNMRLQHSPWLRSVIWDTEAHRPVCVAPPKAETTAIPTGDDHKYNIQEFLDGIMINVFVTKENPSFLQVCTRTSIGAEGSFYSEKSFHDMFIEALHHSHLNKKTLLSALPHATKDTTSVFASFVLQHPEHRVVTRCHKARAWLVQVGFVKENGSVEIMETLHPSEKLYNVMLSLFPNNSFKTDNDLTEFFASYCKENGWFFQGFTFKDNQGRRWRLRNDNYTYLRELRGSEATPLERFLRLRREGKVAEYLKHYSEDRDTFWELEGKLRNKTKEIYQAYCDVHKGHTKQFGDLSKDLQPCVFKLHAHYLENCKPKNEKINMESCVSLINNLPVFEQKRLFAH